MVWILDCVYAGANRIFNRQKIWSLRPCVYTGPLYDLNLGHLGMQIFGNLGTGLLINSVGQNFDRPRVDAVLIYCWLCSPDLHAIVPRLCLLSHKKPFV